jgi:(1->4)-alpha-D-glucan 1-alpha-D-glucosylmutase
VDRCKALGLADGLYLDLAVSVDRGGAEAWGEPTVLRARHEHRRAARRYNLKGQDWGLPAPRRRTREDIFTRTLRAAMRYAGIVRIDHAMGLARLYCIPAGASAHEAPMCSTTSTACFRFLPPKASAPAAS